MSLELEKLYNDFCRDSELTGWKYYWNFIDLKDGVLFKHKFPVPAKSPIDAFRVINYEN